MLSVLQTIHTVQCVLWTVFKKTNTRYMSTTTIYGRRGRITYDFLFIEYLRLNLCMCVWVSRMRKAEFVCKKTRQTHATLDAESRWKEHFLCIWKSLVFSSHNSRFTLGCIVYPCVYHLITWWFVDTFASFFLLFLLLFERCQSVIAILN